MAEEVTQDRKIDKLQFQMENVQVEVKDLKDLVRETNSRLEVMQKGFVGREEFREFQVLVGKLATQKDLENTIKEVEDVKGWQTWAIRIALGALILAGIGALIVTK